jgi:alkylation response protein AidB-like acyl-CoA dehydrogenase
MDLSFSKEDLAFRDEVRAFIEENFTDDLRRKMARTKNGYLDKEDHITWQKRLHAKGWAAPHWPEEFGGPGFTHSQHFIYDREMSAAGVPLTVPFGITMVAPVIMKFGSEEQKKKYLPDILASNVWWCQGYSEPGAGSDLASLQMKAEDKGDHYLCNGSKIWTTQAQHADMIFCLVRTAKMEKRQDGISFLLIDMKTPGVKVEALVTLDGPADGKQEINQVFFEDVKVPKENLIGEENKGWTYAKYLLEFERGNSYAPGLMRSLGKVRKIAADTDVDGERLSDKPEFRAKITDIETQVRAMEYTELRIFSALSNGQNVGPESSMLKCRGTELQQAISELALEGVGYYSMPFVRDTFALSNEEVVGPDYAPNTAPYYFSLRKASIYAGSNEIQRNIMAKAVLGL